MQNPYNKHYKQESYFGKPYPGLIDFFKHYPNKEVVLDLGCGQGRDALFLGRNGYRVVGVDISDVGIEQLNRVAQEEKLQVKGYIADLYSFVITDAYDIVLLDSILHFYKNDVEKETGLLLRIIEDIKPGGLICNFMQKGRKREEILKRIFNESGILFEVLRDGYTEYPEYEAEFHMYLVRKC